ncbi:MAG: extracellular solute-binding protein [Fibrobacteria bacterium]
MKKISLLLPCSLAALALMAGALTGCDRKDGAAARTDAAAKAEAPTRTAVETGGEPEDPDADSNAVPGGNLNIWGGPAPKTLNPWLDWNWFTKELLGLTFEPLLDLHPTENRAYGILAASWDTTADGMTFNYKLDPKARWSDGKAVLCEDVQFYFDVIMNPKNLTSLFRVGLDRFNRPVCADSLSLSVTAKKRHWLNFWEAGGLIAMPKHAWDGKDFNLLNWDLPVVSGPYKLDEVKKDRSVTVRRRADYWGFSKRFNQHKYNFETIRWKFMEDQLKALESLKKGDIDVFPINRAAIWAEKTDFDQVKKGWVGKTKYYNSNPKGFRGWVFNLRRGIFKDPKIREALGYLTNRALMNEKFNHNLLFLLNTYFADLYPDNVNPHHPMREYNPGKARELLTQAGWKPGPDGVLVRDGKRFEFAFTIVTGADLRPINVFVEDLKKAGILVKVEELSWSTFAKRLDNYEFELASAAWGGTRLRDPESMWMSRTATEPSSNNMAGVQDKVVDSLIEMQKSAPDLERRNAILIKLDNRLNEINPYILLWDQDSKWLLYWNKFGTAKYGYGKFQDEDCISTYWYADAGKQAALAKAMAGNAALPMPAAEVHYGK